jgi:peptide/nickel transport system permease protein
MHRLIGRLGAAAITLLGLCAATFLVLAALPGDPLAAFVPADHAAVLGDAERAALAEELGLDRPLPVRFAAWLGDVLAGDFGTSLRSRRPVTVELADRALATLELNGAALLVALGIGLPFGWSAARRPGGWWDRASAPLLLALYALPFFWLALLLQNLLAVQWDLLPLYGRTPAGPGAGAGARLAHLVLPAVSLALHALAFYSRFARNTALEGLGSRHALVARSLGVPEPRVFLRHGLLPSLVPLATLLGVVLPGLVSGSILVETIFSWPGLGYLFVQAVFARDVPVVLALTLLTGVLTVSGSLLADLLGWLIDPRHRQRQRSLAP